MKIDPATCNKNCERCPKAKECDGVLLTNSQKEAVTLCGYFLLLTFLALIFLIIFGV